VPFLLIGDREIGGALEQFDSRVRGVGPVPVLERASKCFLHKGMRDAAVKHDAVDRPIYVLRFLRIKGIESDVHADGRFWRYPRYRIHADGGC
jgi:hypothetical protein